MDPQPRTLPGFGASGFRGVAWSERHAKWRAQIQLNLGLYDTEEEGARIYARANAEMRELAEKLRREIGDRQHLGGISQERMAL